MGGKFFLTVKMFIDKCGQTVGIGKSPFSTITVKTG